MAQEPKKLLKIEKKTPDWFYQLTDDEQYQLLIEMNDLLTLALNEFENNKNILIESKLQLKNNNILLKKIFQPKFGLGINILTCTSLKFNTDIILYIPFNIYLLKSYLALNFNIGAKIYNEFGIVLGTGIIFNF